MSSRDPVLVFVADPAARVGSTFMVGIQRYRVVREFNEWGRCAVLARPCKWYDPFSVGFGRVHQQLQIAARKIAFSLRRGRVALAVVPAPKSVASQLPVRGEAFPPRSRPSPWRSADVIPLRAAS